MNLKWILQLSISVETLALYSITVYFVAFLCVYLNICVKRRTVPEFFFRFHRGYVLCAMCHTHTHSKNEHYLYATILKRLLMRFVFQFVSNSQLFARFNWIWIISRDLNNNNDKSRNSDSKLCWKMLVYCDLVMKYKNANECIGKWRRTPKNTWW